MKVDEMDGSCSMHVRCGKCTHLSDGTPERRGQLRRPLHRLKIVLKLALTSLNATLPGFAATLEWHKVSAVAMLSYFYIIFGIYSMNGMHSVLKEDHGKA
jgi:hypothetical protein